MTTQDAELLSATPAHFDTQEVLAAAQMNVTAFICAGVRYCKSIGQPFEQWVDFVGHLFAPGWDAMEDKTPFAVVRRIAVNFASAGATDMRVLGDDRRAEVTFRWPDTDTLSTYGVSRHELEAFPRIFIPITARLGLQFTYTIEGDRTHMTVAR